MGAAVCRIRVVKLLSLECAVPAQGMTQKELLSALRGCSAWSTLREGSRELLTRVLSGDSGIGRRYFARCDLEELGKADGGKLAEIFELEAPALASEAVGRALSSAGVFAEELDALLVCTCTGYLCPGVSGHVAQRLGLRADVMLVDLVGQGCGAALPLLATAEGLLAAGAQSVACVAVEVSSAAFYLDDDAGVLVSLCLFGDGAAACVCTKTRKQADALVELSDFRQLHWPEQREELRFVNSGGKLRNVLRPSVPDLVADAVAKLLPELAQESSHSALLAHSGGRKVIEALETRFPGVDLSASKSVLRNFGNMSSPSVLFVLRKWLDYGGNRSAWLASYGAGFTAFACRARKV